MKVIAEEILNYLGNSLIIRTYSTALKGVISRVLKEDEAPISEYRPEETIEGILTPTGVSYETQYAVMYI